VEALHGKSLANYNLPELTMYGQEVKHKLGRWNLHPESLSMSADDVLNMELEDQSLHIFVDRKVGKGKTYLVNMICNKRCLLGCIVLPIAIAAISMQHYMGRRTKHSAFKASP
jgi:hypothetical protein